MDGEVLDIYINGEVRLDEYVALAGLILPLRLTAPLVGGKDSSTYMSPQGDEGPSSAIPILHCLLYPFNIENLVRQRVDLKTVVDGPADAEEASPRRR